jgi:hypothetical protein
MTQNFQNPDRMTPKEVVLEISTLQDEIYVRGKRVYELARSLYQRVRRLPLDESTSVYITYSNSMVRFSGTIEQLLNRNKRVSRILNLISEREERTDRNSAELVKKEKIITPNISNPIDTLLETYSESSDESSDYIGDSSDEQLGNDNG